MALPGKNKNPKRIAETWIQPGVHTLAGGGDIEKQTLTAKNVHTGKVGVQKALGSTTEPTLVRAKDATHDSSATETAQFAWVAAQLQYVADPTPENLTAMNVARDTYYSTYQAYYGTPQPRMKTRTIPQPESAAVRRFKLAQIENRGTRLGKERLRAL